MSLPQTIVVRYTEEEAGYVTVRPVVKQTFKLEELLDMILSVTGKDAARVAQLLRAGTVVYHFYRYSWAGFETDLQELAAALAPFPEPEPSRPFSAELCTVAILESGGVSPRHMLEISRAQASQRRMFRGESFWEGLLAVGQQEPLHYHGFSYGRRADIYRLDLDGENMLLIKTAAERLARRNLREALAVLEGAAAILFVCPRPGTNSKNSSGPA